MSLGHILRSQVPKAILQGHPTAGLRMGFLETGLWSAHAMNRPQPLKCKAGPNRVLSDTAGAQQGRELGGSFTRAERRQTSWCECRILALPTYTGHTHMCTHTHLSRVGKGHTHAYMLT